MDYYIAISEGLWSYKFINQHFLVTIHELILTKVEFEIWIDWDEIEWRFVICVFLSSPIHGDRVLCDVTVLTDTHTHMTNHTHKSNFRYYSYESIWHIYHNLEINDCFNPTQTIIDAFSGRMSKVILECNIKALRTKTTGQMSNMKYKTDRQAYTSL